MSRTRKTPAEKAFTAAEKTLYNADETLKAAGAAHEAAKEAQPFETAWVNRPRTAKEDEGLRAQHAAEKALAKTILPHLRELQRILSKAIERHEARATEPYDPDWGHGVEGREAHAEERNGGRKA